MVRFVERHGKVRFRASRLPRPNYFPRGAIHDDGFLGLGKIHKDSRSARFQLKGFRVRIDRDFAQFCSCINHREGAASQPERAASISDPD